MTGRNGYGYGNGYSDAGRYDQGDGAYGGSSNLGVNEYNNHNGRSAGNTGAGRRPGGYGGFYPEPAQQPSLSPAPSPERRRDREDRDRQQQSTSRSRSRNETADRRYQGSRDDRSRDGLRPPDSRGRDVNPSDAGALEGSTREMQSVEGSSMLLWKLCRFLD
jgi:Xaa-Pro aminopeptidase